MAGERDEAWRRLPFSDEPMGRQLALSEAALSLCGETNRPALRWYVPADPSLVLGNGQKPGLVSAACEAAGIRVYRRTSGGTAVLANAALLSLDVILPATHPLSTTDVVTAYRWIGECWEMALHGLGVEKARALSTEEVRKIPPLATDDPLRLACYGTLSPWEVVVGQRKLVGLCQVRRKPGALYQVGVYLQFDPKALGVFLDLNNNRRKRLAARLHNAALGLDQAAGQALAADAVMRAVEQTLAERYHARLTDDDYTTSERTAADQIQRERFHPFI